MAIRSFVNLQVVFVLLALLSCSLDWADAQDDERIMPGHTRLEHVVSPLPYTYLSNEELPMALSWGNVNGRSYLTKSLNQHIPQYCGSCWAHAALSVLGDRIMIAQSQEEDSSILDEFNLSVQFLLNCAGEYAGSCYGGSTTGVFDFIQDMGYIPYETCQPYLACSDDSDEGICSFVNTTCSPEAICRTCSPDGICQAVTTFPNATVAEYGRYRYELFATMAEIYLRGPVTASIDAGPIHKYPGGVLWDNPKYHSDKTNHAVSIVGWGYDYDEEKQYWIVRNSWGQY
jgi:cathepsin X